jgi:hypothetical protein
VGTGDVARETKRKARQQQCCDIKLVEIILWAVVVVLYMRTLHLFTGQSNGYSARQQTKKSGPLSSIIYLRSHLPPGPVPIPRRCVSS